MPPMSSPIAHMTREGLVVGPTSAEHEEGACAAIKPLATTLPKKLGTSESLVFAFFLCFWRACGGLCPIAIHFGDLFDFNRSFFRYLAVDSFASWWRLPIVVAAVCARIRLRWHPLRTSPASRRGFAPFAFGLVSLAFGPAARAATRLAPSAEAMLPHLGL